MTEAQRLQLAIAESRAKLMALTAPDVTPDDAAITAGMAELSGLEKRMAAAVLIDATAPEVPDAPRPERRELQDQLELRGFIQESLSGQPCKGANAEYRQEFGLADGQVPMAALLPLDGENRADVVTPAPASGLGVNQQMIVGRVFAESVAAFLGVTFPPVGVGALSFPVMTGGTTAAMLLRGATQDATAAAFTVTSATPKRLAARYLFNLEDLQTFAGMENALRADLRMAMGNQMDLALLRGSGSGLAEILSIFNTLTEPAAPDTATVAYAGWVEDMVGAVDGLYASSLSDVRLLMGPASYRNAAETFTAQGDISAVDYLRARSGGVRASALVEHSAGQSGNPNYDNALTVALGQATTAVAPVWSSFSLIRDMYSNAAQGQVSLTAIALWDLVIPRRDAYRWLKMRAD